MIPSSNYYIQKLYNYVLITAGVWYMQLVINDADICVLWNIDQILFIHLSSLSVT